MHSASHRDPRSLRQPRPPTIPPSPYSLPAASDKTLPLPLWLLTATTSSSSSSCEHFWPIFLLLADSASLRAGRVFLLEQANERKNEQATVDEKTIDDVSWLGNRAGKEMAEEEQEAGPRNSIICSHTIRDTVPWPCQQQQQQRHHYRVLLLNEERLAESLVCWLIGPTKCGAALVFYAHTYL